MTEPQLDDPSRYSLWLTPDLITARPLQKTIDALASKYACLAFYPHMTICSQLTGSLSSLTLKLEEIAQTHTALELRGKTFAHRATLYQSLFIELEKTPDLLAFQKSILKELQHHESQRFFPHVSLAYIDPHSFDAASEIAELDKSLLSKTRFDHITLMETSGTQEHWAKIIEVNLNAE